MAIKKISKDFFKENVVYIGFAVFVYLLSILISCHISIESTFNPGLGLFETFFNGLNSFLDSPFNLRGLTQSLPSFFKSFGITSLIYVIAAAWIKFEIERQGKTMKGKEAGSASWHKDMASFNKRYSDPPDSPNNDGPNNMILTQDVLLNMNSRVTRRNNNVCVVGGSGSGKSRFFVKPNLLQANANFVVTDPSGELLAATGDFLKNQGYEIKVFNLVEMSKSDCYNPFNYIRDELGVKMMINCLIQNTTPAGQKSGDPFWEKSETALLQALCFYLWLYRPKEEQNFTNVMKLLRAAEINEQNPNAKSELDIIFEGVKKTDPNSMALKSYLTFKMGGAKTLKSILISCAVRLDVFNMKAIESLTGRDTIDLSCMGEGKKALFVIIPTADSTYNFLVSMMYSQLFETLYYIAETQRADKRLESPVRFLLDEFVNIGQIPEFNKKLATMRKYEISCNIILQNLAQIKAMYKDDWQTIIGNCDSFLFLGGQEYDTLDYISKELGDQTITSVNRSRSFGKGGGSQSRSDKGRKLMFADEIGRLSDSQCILIIRGLKPFLGNKYEYTKHPNYKYTGDADPKLIYVNDINNTLVDDQEDIELEYAKKKVLSFVKATDTNKSDAKILGNIKSIQGLAKSLNIKNAEELFERFTFIPPDPLTEVEATIIETKENKTETEIISDIKIIDLIKENEIKEKEKITRNTSSTSNNGATDDVIEKTEEVVQEEFKDIDDIIAEKRKEKDNSSDKTKKEINIDDSYIGTFVQNTSYDGNSEFNSMEEWIFDSF